MVIFPTCSSPSNDLRFRDIGYFEEFLQKLKVQLLLLRAMSPLE